MGGSELSHDKGPFFYDLAGQRFFKLRDQLTFGRSEGDVTFPNDGLLSRQHFRIHLSGGNAELEDLGSRNGTLLNGRKLPAHEKAPLKDNDIVEVGDQIFSFTLTQEIPGVTYESVKKLDHQQRKINEARTAGGGPAPTPASTKPAAAPTAAVAATPAAAIAAPPPAVATPPTAAAAPPPAAATPPPAAAPAAAPSNDRRQQSSAEGKSITRGLLRPARVRLNPLDGVQFHMTTQDGTKTEPKVANLSVSGVGFLPDAILAWPPLNETFAGVLTRGDESLQLKLKIVRRNNVIIGCAFVEAPKDIREKIGSWFTLELSASSMLDNSRNLETVRTESMTCHQFIGDNGCELYYSEQESVLKTWHVAFFGQRIEFDMSGKARVTSQFVRGTVTKEQVAKIVQDAGRFLENIEGLSQAIRTQMLEKIQAISGAAR